MAKYKDRQLRATDDQIKDAIRAGKTQKQIIAEFQTHAQRFTQLKSEIENTRFTVTKSLPDRFILNMF